jgi:hypothetical protein
MKTDLLDRLDHYYSLSDEDRDETLGDILAIANGSPEKFKQMIVDERVVDHDNLGIIYTALATDLLRWSGFLVEEVKRLLALAAQSKKPNEVLECLEEFSFMQVEKFTHRDALVDILRKELDNTHPSFRFWAVNLLGDFIRPDDEFTITKLRSLLKDPDWRIRYWTNLAVSDLGKLQEHENFTFWEKVRGKFLIFFPFS